MCDPYSAWVPGMKRVVMLTPFDDEMHGYLTRYVANAGIQVVAAHSVLSSIAQRDSRWYEVSTMPLSVPFRAAKELYHSAKDADGVWITGALMPSVAVIEPLEEDLGGPFPGRSESTDFRLRAVVQAPIGA